MRVNCQEYLSSDICSWKRERARERSSWFFLYSSTDTCTRQEHLSLDFFRFCPFFVSALLFVIYVLLVFFLSLLTLFVREPCPCPFSFPSFYLSCILIIFLLSFFLSFFLSSCLRSFLFSSLFPIIHSHLFLFVFFSSNLSFSLFLLCPYAFFSFCLSDL